MTAFPQILSGTTTPRVDAAERFMRSPHRSPLGFVPSSVARQLEVELMMALEVVHGRASVSELESLQGGGAVPMPPARAMAASSTVVSAVAQASSEVFVRPVVDAEDAGVRPRKKVSAEGAGEKNIYETGQMLFSKGDKADHLAIILEGEVEIFDPADNETIAVLGHGASFGEQAILEGGLRGASARAKNRVVCLEISTSPLRTILKADPGILTPIIESLLLQLNMANKLVKADKTHGAVESFEVLSQTRLSTMQLQELLAEIYSTGDNKGLSSEGLMFLKLQASDKLRTSVLASGESLANIYENDFASGFIVVEGHIEADSETCRYKLGPGSVLGLAEGLTDSPLGWSLKALDNVTLMNMPIDKALRGLDHANPGIRGIVRYTADRILELQKRL